MSASTSTAEAAAGPSQEPEVQETVSIRPHRAPTGYVYMINNRHRSPWDLSHPESPERCLQINRSMVFGFCDRVKLIREGLDGIDFELIKECHSDDYCELLHGLCQRQNETETRQYDSVYFTKKSYTAALRTVSRVLNITKQVAEGTLKNAFANVRPPGHHASDKPNGYCLFNNVAIAARYLLKNNLAERILIVDYDVHHGQGTQRTFYDDKNVLYFSIHRYEYGSFWPNLKESSFEFIGSTNAKGYNINVPLNSTRLGDTDYLAIVTQLLLPVAYEFNPNIILFSSGYDSCMGDDKGQMEVSPAFYAHLINLLGSLANGKMVAVLEGGYCYTSLRDSAVATIKAMLNDPCPPLQHKSYVNETVIDSINNVRVALRPYWSCFFFMEPIINLMDATCYDRYHNHMAVAKYIGEEPAGPFPIRNFPLEYDVYTQAAYLAKLRLIRKAHERGLRNKVAYSHSNIDSYSPIIVELKRLRLLEVMVDIAAENETDSPEGSGDSLHSADANLGEQQKLTIRLLREIKGRTISQGFGFFEFSDNDAVKNLLMAADHAIYRLRFKRVLIINFDMNFHEDIQTYMYRRNDVMVISIHKLASPEKSWAGHFTQFGIGKSAGYNMNIPLMMASISNADYLMIWLKLVLPVSYSFNPDLILVSAGFDAELKEENKLDPVIFGHLMQLMKPIAPILLMYLGGGNVEYASLAIVSCVKVFLGLPIPMFAFKPPKKATAEIVVSCFEIFKHYWPILRVNKALHPAILSQEDFETSLSDVNIANIWI